MGCTIGARIIKPGHEFVLFKNKDLPRESFDDQLVVEPMLFGVLGLHIPAGSPSGEDILSGFSIGANSAGVCACNSHVRSVDGGENYDLLTEAALRGTSDAKQAAQKIIALSRYGQHNWANILIADPNGIAVVEVADDAVGSADSQVAARANEHLLAHSGSDAGQPSPRAQAALAGLRPVSGPADVMALCRSHEREPEGANLCAHSATGARNTVYSYVLHWRRGEFVLFVTRGHPCEHEYARIPLRFPLEAHALQAVYPRT